MEKKQNNYFREELVLFLSVMKWAIIASIVGMVVGGSTAVFIHTLMTAQEYVHQIQNYYFLMPIALVASYWTVMKIAPEARGHGTEKVIEALHKRDGNTTFWVAPAKIIGTALTIAFGGSAGKEGPAAQIGAAVSSTFARHLRFNAADQKKIVICGISAGFSAVFGTPIAGAIFGVEVLFAGSMFYPALLPSFIAGLVAYITAASLGVPYESFTDIPISIGDLSLLNVVLAGIFFGLCSFLLIEIQIAIKKIATRLLGVSFILRALVGGACLLAIFFLFGDLYLGMGLETIEAAVEGEPVPLEAPLVKMVATSITLSFGGSGGIVTPVFFIGATAGNIFASLLELNVSAYAAIGLVALLAGTSNAPIAASIMAIELFGPGLGTYAAIACAISFLMTGHRSVYPSQKLAVSKSSSLKISGDDLDEQMRVEVDPKYDTIRRFKENMERGSKGKT